ncbi:high-affinity iron permease [Dinochytrium kinnereticum]|nr:high-affinity iron permease [Dinochytrium kinnereticum]
MVAFSFPVFFVLFREATEAALVVSVLLSFIDNAIPASSSGRSDPNKGLRLALRRRVWIGTALGLGLSLAIGGVLVFLWFEYKENLWPNAEKLWEATFSLVAAFFLTAMSIAFLRYDSMAKKWRSKLSHAVTDHLVVLPHLPQGDNQYPPQQLEDEEVTVRTSVHSDAPLLRGGRGGGASYDSMDSGVVSRDGGAGEEVRGLLGGERGVEGEEGVEKSLNGMFLIPFVTVLREGLEGVVFLAGIAVSESPSSIPISGLAGLLLGLLLGLVIYQTGSYLSHEGKDRRRHPLHLFFVCSSVMLLMLASGLVARAVRGFEVDYWVRMIGGATDPDALGSYHIRSALW